MARDIIGVIGLGTMGLGIAQVFAANGFQVLATDAVEAARASATDRLRAALAPRVAKGALTEAAMEETLSRLTVVPDVSAMTGAGLVIEAILETLPAKQAIFSALEAVVTPDCVLATNTSSLSVTAIADGLKVPERLLGIHFFNPAPVMKLVELVAHKRSSEAALTRARQITEAAGKTVIACPDRPGFIVNRCARPFYGEALALLEEGRTAVEIDAAMLAAGYRIGPFALIDLVGADINLAATETMQAAFRHPRYHVFQALKDQVASGHLGRKTGQGFLFPATVTPSENRAISDRVEAALANEAAWLLSEGGTTPEGIDTALKLGLNFPRGPFEIIAAQGAARIRTFLAALEDKAPAQLKGRYQPAPSFMLA